MTDVDALVAFIRACVAEDRRTAQAVPYPRWSVSGPPGGVLTLDGDAIDAMCDALESMLGMEYQIDSEWGSGYLREADTEAWTYARKLAQPFAGRPGWRDEWAVTQ